MTLNIEQFKPWINKSEQAQEELSLWPVHNMMAALDVNPSQWPTIGDDLPATAHWNYFVPRVVQSKIDVDGHPVRGDFLPPIPLPRRMWAGSRIQYHQPMKMGQTIQKTSTIKDIKIKEGKSGSLAFVTVKHEYQNSSGLALTEEQDLVYRDPPPSMTSIPERNPAPTPAQWTQSVATSTPLLFRYSSVTFNAHKIHYDEPYAKEVEGYPGLVVHGQLIATFLLQSLQQAHPEKTLASFNFKAVSPLFCGETLQAQGALSPEGADLWACTDQGGLTMQANVTWQSK